MKLSGKISLVSRFGFTLLNLYLVGYLLFNSSLIISLLAIPGFIYLLAKSALLIMYIQWRSRHNWDEEWDPNDELFNN